MKKYTIGIDIGTTGTKAVLLEIGLGVVASSSAETRLFSDEAGYSEAETSDWLENVYKCVKDLISSTSCRPESIVGISTTGMVPAVVLLDDDGRPLSRAILQNDARAVKEIDELSRKLSSISVLEDTGSPLSQQSVAPTLRWVQAHAPQIWAASRYVVGSYDWVLIALGGKPHVEANWALESGLFFIDGKPHSEIMRAAGLNPTQIPYIAKAGDLVGHLDSKSAEEMGLVPGIPLYVGGADHVLSAFSAGVADEGDGLIKLGGAGDILMASKDPIVDQRLYLDVHPIEGIWLPNGCMATSGSLIRWFQKITGVENLAKMDIRAESCKPAEVLCLPYFLGEKSPLHDPDLRGAFFGMHLGSSQADLYRSVLEAIAFGFRHHVEVMAERGIILKRAMVTNGGSRSTLWKQIHSDVLGISLYPVVDHPGASLGAAVIAGYGAAEIDSLSHIHKYVNVGPVVTPDQNLHDVYDHAYKEWRELATATIPLAHQLSERTRG